MSFYDIRLFVRFRDDELILIKKVIKNEDDVYSNVSDFVRASVVRELRKRFPLQLAKVDKQVMFKKKR